MTDRRSTRSTISAGSSWTSVARAGAPRQVLLRAPREAPPGTLRLVKPVDSPAPASTEREAEADAPPPAVTLEELERLLASRDFDGTPRSRAFLRFVVEETLGGRQDGLTQSAVATRVFGRRQDFDPTIDPIVRIQAGRLRRSLERYYLMGGAGDPVRIELPRGGYVPVTRWAKRPDSRGSTEPACSRKGEDWPAVVVGPFRNGGSGPAVEEMLLRFCERLSVEMGRHGDVSVVLRSELDKVSGDPSGRGGFTLSGHLASDGRGWRAIARLVDSRSARQVWAEELRGGGKPTSCYDEAARAIAARVASEHGVVARTLAAELRHRPSAEPTPYDAILRSYQFFASRDPNDLVAALHSLQQAVRLEPECGLAWVQLARLCVDNHAFELTSLDTPIDLAAGYAHTAVQLDPFSHRARGALADALWVAGDRAAARSEARRALDLDPHSGACLDSIGWLMALLDEGERGAALVRDVIARGPSRSPVVFHALWAHHLRRGEIAESQRAAQQCRDRSSFWPPLTRACSLGHLGSPQAKAEVAELLARKPDFASRGRALIGRWIKRPELLERVLVGLRRAGLALD